ncbi:hypothetical protein ACODT3_41245 [Streptomyces sp. 4.24]|uniref:hypothetical protein n=1 Tax=Streptomyces tritrimontium TaxID=3406573 RepID=UPI003BB56F69
MSEQEMSVQDAGDRSTCNVCGKGIVQPKGQGRRRKTCSAACRQQSYMLRRWTRIPEKEDLVLRAAPVVQLPAPAPAPDLTVLPDPPAAAPVVVPAAAPQAARRRSAPAIPGGVREGLNPQGWLRAFDVYDERQASLFEDQGDGDVQGSGGE